MIVWTIENALKVSVILLSGLILSVVLRRHSAALRHWVLAVAVLCAWATPPLRMVMPVVDSGPWWESAQYLRASYRLSTPIRLLQSNHPSLLITWGWRRPTVLLPAAASTWSRERIDVVMMHELAHIARRDWLWQVAVEG